MSWSSTFFAGCGSAALTDSASDTLSLVIDVSPLIRSYTDLFTVPMPGNIALVGADDLPLATYLRSAPSSVALDPVEMADRMCQAIRSTLERSARSKALVAGGLATPCWCTVRLPELSRSVHWPTRRGSHSLPPARTSRLPHLQESGP